MVDRVGALLLAGGDLVSRRAIAFIFRRSRAGYIIVVAVHLFGTACEFLIDRRRGRRLGGFLREVFGAVFGGLVLGFRRRGCFRGGCGFGLFGVFGCGFRRGGRRVFGDVFPEGVGELVEVRGVDV